MNDQELSDRYDEDRFLHDHHIHITGVDRNDSEIESFVQDYQDLFSMLKGLSRSCIENRLTSVSLNGRLRWSFEQGIILTEPKTWVSRYKDEESMRLGRTIESQIKLSGVTQLTFKVGEDHSGCPAIWIEIFVDHKICNTIEKFIAKIKEVEAVIDPVVRIVSERWPYFRALNDSNLEASWL